MRIGIFYQNYYKGGLDTFLINLINSKNDKHEINLYINKSHPGTNLIKKSLKKKINIFQYDFFSIEEKKYNKNFFIKIFYYTFFYFIFLFQIKKIKNIIFKKKNDKFLVVNGGYPGGHLCLAAICAIKELNPKKKTWLNIHNYPTIHNKIWHIFFNITLKLKLKDSLYGVISVSQNCIDHLKKVNILKEKKFKKIYNGLIPKKINNKINLKKKFGLRKKDKIILMLGEYSFRKGHFFILEVMKKIVEKNSNIFLFIYGSKNTKDYKNIFKRYSKLDLKKNVILNDFSNHSYALINSSDLVVVPSQEFESFGYVALEAESLGKPVVASREGGLVEVVKNNYNGYLINKNNTRLFANKISYLLKSDYLVRRFSNNSKIFFKKKFNAKRMYESYIKTI